MKAKASFIRSDRAVELNAVACVHLDLPFVIYPWHAEFELSLRLDQPLQQGILFVVLLMNIINHHIDTVTEKRMQKERRARYAKREAVGDQ